jgi:tetratricopeptide (TPR) repeat protein
MSSPLLKEIRTKVQAEDYNAAYQLCRSLPESDRNYATYSIEANCCRQLKLLKESALALEKAIKLPGAPQPQMQKLWKTLADLYEELGDWGNHALAMIKLYDINLEKGNIERVLAVAEIIGMEILPADYNKIHDPKLKDCFALNHFGFMTLHNRK